MGHGGGGGGGGGSRRGRRWQLQLSLIRCGALISLAACGGVGMFLFHICCGFSPTIFILSHCLASHCKGSGCTYSVDSGSLYKAVGRDPYSSPIHGNRRQEWENGRRPAGSFAPRNRPLLLFWSVGSACVKHLCQHLGLQRMREKHACRRDINQRTKLQLYSWLLLQGWMRRRRKRRRRRRRMRRRRRRRKPRQVWKVHKA